MFRIGFGYDVHKLDKGENLVLGGIEIPHTKGTVGHSDGDVLIHAIIDAILGAANLRDIGFHFPDNASKYKNIDSKILLKDTMKLLHDANYIIGNIDTTLSLEKPKIKDFIHRMKAVLAKVMNININDLSIKATTTEKLGFEGRQEGVSAYAVVLISPA